MFDHVIAVNLKDVFLCLKHKIRAMSAGGRPRTIVNIGSVASLVAASGMPAYAASAVLGVTRTAAVEYARCNIRVNATNRGATADEIAAAALWLASDAASFVTSQGLPVDGGMVVR